MVEHWAKSETFAATEVSQFALARLVVNDDSASNGAHRCGIEVERSVVVLPGRNIRVYGGFSQDIKGEFSLRK